MEAVSVPRLELLAAVLGAKMATVATTALKISMDQVTLWADSMNVLYWIRSRSRVYKMFVANRISIIQSLTDAALWRYVPTSDNPADLASRGCTVDALSQSSQWWKGPAFLTQEPSQWPANKVEQTKDSVQEQKLPKNESVNIFSGLCTLFATPNDTQQSTWRLNPQRFSSWLRLKRVTAWVLRFVENCALPKTLRESGELSIAEMNEAETRILKDLQEAEFGDEMRALRKSRSVLPTSKLQPLTPFLDENGLMRCKGRLELAEQLSFDARHPIILPRGAWITKLIVRHYHDANNHCAGVNYLWSQLCQQYWILAGREEIRSYERECLFCEKRRAKPLTQLMAPLPRYRLSPPLHAFSKVSVDYGGPFETVQGRGKRREKCYLCLFTCLITRGVHLELSYRLDTDAFLRAFNRMVNRRGVPSLVISDNGTNFVGANRVIAELVKAFDQRKIDRTAACSGVEWQLNPPSSPHFGGVHEVMIGAAKRAIYAILKNASVTDEELMSTFCGVEALLNSRPLLISPLTTVICVH